MRKVQKTVAPNVESKISFISDGRSAESQATYAQARCKLAQEELDAERRDLQDLRNARPDTMNERDQKVNAIKRTESRIAELQAEIAEYSPAGSQGADLDPLTLPKSDHPEWNLAPVIKYQGYREALHAYVVAAHRASKSIPKAADVIDEWRRRPTWPIRSVDDDGIVVYEDAEGTALNISDTRAKTLDAIRSSINRMIIRKRPTGR